MSAAAVEESSVSGRCSEEEEDYDDHDDDLDVSEEEDLDEVDEEDEDEASISQRFEPIGLHYLRSYLELKLAELSKSAGSPSDGENKDDGRGAAAAMEKKGKKKKKKKKKKKSKGQKQGGDKRTAGLVIDSVDLSTPLDGDDDYYGILGLADYRIVATIGDINYAYKRLQSLCHPDKFSSKSKLEQNQAQERFKLLEKAYKELSDPLFKRLYDSTLPFDDSIPDERELIAAGFFRDDSEIDSSFAISSSSSSLASSGFDFKDKSVYPFCGDAEKDKATIDRLVNQYSRLKLERANDFYQL